MNSTASKGDVLLAEVLRFGGIFGDKETTLDRSQIRREMIGGITTFFTMSYIIFVNPAILATEGTGMSFNGVVTATVLLCFLMTLFMGLFAKLPYAVAPGMGINSFFAYSIIIGHQVHWSVALGMVFWSGVLFVLISVTPVREAMAKAIPLNLRIATAGGIGIFLAFIGLKNTGFIVAHPVTFVQFGGLGAPVLLSLVGLFVTIRLMKSKNPLAFLAGILAVTVLAWGFGLTTPPEHYFSAPNFTSVFLQLDLLGALKLALVPTIISLMFTDLFDSISTFMGVSHACNMLDKDGHPKNLKQGLIVDAFATLGGGLFGTSSGTTYIESTAGIEAGGRTGLTSVITALCFLPCFFIAPLAQMIPSFATAPVLIIVGAMMFRTIRQLSFGKMEDIVPAYLTILLIPLTFSITQGILWGFITHVALYCINGRAKEVHPVTFALGALSVLLLAIETMSL